MPITKRGWHLARTGHRRRWRPADWWLADSTFELTDGPEYGGQPFGAAWPQPDGE